MWPTHFLPWRRHCTGYILQRVSAYDVIHRSSTVLAATAIWRHIGRPMTVRHPSLRGVDGGRITCVVSCWPPAAAGNRWSSTPTGWGRGRRSAPDTRRRVDLFNCAPLRVTPNFGVRENCSLGPWRRRRRGRQSGCASWPPPAALLVGWWLSKDARRCVSQLPVRLGPAQWVRRPAVPWPVTDPLPSADSPDRPAPARRQPHVSTEWSVPAARPTWPDAARVAVTTGGVAAVSNRLRRAVVRRGCGRWRDWYGWYGWYGGHELCVPAVEVRPVRYGSGGRVGAAALRLDPPEPRRRRSGGGVGSREAVPAVRRCRSRRPGSTQYLLR